MSNRERPVHKRGFSISNPKRFMLILGASFVLAGLDWFVSSWSCGVTDAEMREQMLRQAVELARTIDPEYAKALSFTAADKGTSVYEQIRRQMIAYGRYTGQRNIYSMAVRGDAIIFGPENLTEKDPMASPPGTVYENPSAEDFQVFKTGRATTMGPNTDEYGTFVSALAPVLDPKNGKVLMVVGLDVPTDEWETRVACEPSSANHIYGAFSPGLAGRNDWYTRAQPAFDSTASTIAVPRIYNDRPVGHHSHRSHCFADLPG